MPFGLLSLQGHWIPLPPVSSARMRQCCATRHAIVQRTLVAQARVVDRTTLCEARFSLAFSTSTRARARTFVDLAQ